MRENLDLTHGLIVAEAVMMAAAPKLGRQHAHDVVYDACRKAIEAAASSPTFSPTCPEIVDALGGEDAIRASLRSRQLSRPLRPDGRSRVGSLYAE